MFVSKCDPNRTRGSGFKYSCSLEKNKLFVKGNVIYLIFNPQLVFLNDKKLTNNSQYFNRLFLNC